MELTERTPWRYAGKSDQGLVRTNNEDLFYGDAERGIFIVVDGVGGHAAGEQAAEIAVRVLRSRLERLVGSAEERLREGITLANNEIFQQAAANCSWHGMSCVLTAAVIEDGLITVGHVGDTRLYRMQAGELVQLTRDHSLIGELVAEGFLDEMEAMRHPRRNEITRDVGSKPHQPEDAEFIEIGTHTFGPGCALLMCSDGLSDLVTPAEIQTVVEDDLDRQETIVARLIDAAHAAGGKDNITPIYLAWPKTAVPGADLEEGSELNRLSPHTLVHAAGRGWTGRARRSFPAGVFCGLLLALAGGTFWWWQADLRKPYTIPPVVEAQKTWQVDAQNPRAFTNLEDALRVARSGDAIVIAPGEYQERIVCRQVLIKH